MDLKKIEAITNKPKPKLVEELKRFIGLTRHYRRFIVGYGIIAHPLIRLLKKNAFS